MLDINEKVPVSPDNNSQTPSGSLLGEILSTPESTPVDLLDDSFIPGVSKEETTSEIPSSEQIPVSEAVQKPKKKSMSTGTFLRIVGAILLVALIFFGAFLSYIVFNPGQASFFISFGINPGDIARLLKQLVSAIFGVVTFMLSVVWIVYLFRAILTKKEYKKKKTVSIIFALFFGVLLFSEITLWAFLVKKINATDYENPNGWVIVYDNEKFVSERFKNSAQLNGFDNLIGPLELKFDLKADANFVGKSMEIESYKIDFDGAKCQGWTTSVVAGKPSDVGIICVFDEAKVYKPTGTYEGTDLVTHKPRTVTIGIPVIQIVGVVNIKKPKTYKDKAITYDASKLASLGKIGWYTEKWGDAPVSTEPVFSVTMKSDEQILCLNVFWGTTCDKLFIIPKESDSNITAKIIREQDPEDPKMFTFHLNDKVVKTGEITSYKWIIDNNVISTDETCSHTFADYGNMKITLVLTDSSANITELTDSFSVLPPLKFTKGSAAESLLKITNTTGKSLIDGTYTPSLKAYHITDVTIPVVLQFDATDVKVDNYGYDLSKVEWDFNGDGVFEKTGPKITYELIEEKRYTVQVRYTFTDKEKNISSAISEKIIFDSGKKDINLALKLTQDSEYVPATVHVDGSASIPKQGTITKFIYDFGEGRGPVEGDAVQDYRYNFSGEYTITLTVVRDDGTKELFSRKIVLKDIPKRIVINTSVSSGIAGKPIDFDTNGTIGQIEAYHWDFGDGNTSDEPAPTHVYSQKGKYTVKIMVTYADRTVRSTDREVTIIGE